MTVATLVKYDHTAIDIEFDSLQISALLTRHLQIATRSTPDALRQASIDHLATKGKKLRGRLALETCLAFGADFDTALNWAVAVELLHNASLVHDDLCDRDDKRRGKSTVFQQYGDAIAVCLGDYYIATGFSLAALASAKTIALYSDSVVTSVSGQAGEFVLSGYPSWSQYCEIAAKKTAPLLSLPILGAAAITAYPVDKGRVERYFAHAAICFQIINDLQNFTVAIDAGTLSSDLLKCRPNALIACFRDALPVPTQVRFDRWSDDIRSATICAETPLTEEWWHNIKQSDAFGLTVQRLHLHFSSADHEMKRLPSAMQSVLTAFQQWLAHELARASHCANFKEELST